MKIVNLTPHSVNLFNNHTGAYDAIAPSGIVARVAATTVPCGTVGAYAATTTSYGDVENLPEPEPETIYVVSSIVAQRVPERDDVYIPNESVRDESGRIVGCRSLGKI